MRFSVPSHLRYSGALTLRRHFFTLPNLSEFSPVGTETQTYHERKTLPYDQIQLYNIVADVRSYPKFVPFCTESRVFISSQTEGLPLQLQAELTVSFLTFKESYVSKVTCHPFESVEAVATLSSPLFKTLSTTWRFQPASAPSPHFLGTSLRSTYPCDTVQPMDFTKPQTLVTLDLLFAFANPVYATVSGAFFKQVSRLIVKAFEERCLEVYGPGQK